MFLAESYKRRLYDEGFQEGIKDAEEIRKSNNPTHWTSTGIAGILRLGKSLGRAEERKRWLEWHNRRVKAEAAGQPFNEAFPAAKQ